MDEVPGAAYAKGSGHPSLADRKGDSVRIEVDRNRCEGHAMCEAVAPDFFSVDDEGNLIVFADNVAPGDQAQVQDAVLTCPVAALKLIQE